MRVLIAPDSFKGTLSAVRAAEALRWGVTEANPRAIIDLCPVADGGEGTLDAFERALGTAFTRHPRMVLGPLGESVAGCWGSIQRSTRPTTRPCEDDSPENSSHDNQNDHSEVIGVVEMAQASGIMLVPPERRDPTRTTTYGTGELIKAAAEHGCDEIIVAIGGSATCDGGAGMAQALGVRFFSNHGLMGEELMDDRPTVRIVPLAGGDLIKIARIDFKERLNLPPIRVACDVNNPLCGPRGSAAVYGPQKGATPRQVEELDRGLAHLASLLPQTDPSAPGSGAAGGIGFGLRAFLGAELTPGIDLILDMINFRSRLQQADLVITGEGRFDDQTLHGKAVAGVSRLAGEAGVAMVVIAGSVQVPAPELPGAQGVIERVVGLTDRFGNSRAMSQPAECLREAASEVMRMRGHAP